MTNYIFQGQNVELSEEVKSLKESEEEQQRALRALEQATTKMETEKIKQHAESVSHNYSYACNHANGTEGFERITSFLLFVRAFSLFTVLGSVALCLQLS